MLRKKTSFLYDHIHLFGIFVGLISFFKGHMRIGLKRVLHPVGYWRYPVFNLVIKHLAGMNNLEVLDIGSPKLLGLFLALRKGFKVRATDIQDLDIFTVWQTYYNNCKSSRLTKIDKFSNAYLFVPEIQDARALSYPVNSFDLVYSISVLEHIPEDGDTAATKEIKRILRPGGTVIIEVPFSYEKYETYVTKCVYDRCYIDKPVFYQRHYDAESIYNRIINPSGLLVDKIYIIRERLPFESILAKLPVIFQLPFLCVTPIISILNHKGTYVEVLKPDKNYKSKNASDIILYLKKF